MKIDEAWIRAHLPKEVENEPIDFFSGEYLDGLKVMHEGERAFETWIRLKNGTIRNPLRVPDNFAWSDPNKRPIEKD